MQKLNILVIDDEVGIRKLLRDALTLHGHNVLCAENGIQALSLLTNHEIDTVYLDIRMQDGNGLLALKKIRMLWPSLRVVIISSCAQKDVLDETLVLGADAWLIEPFNMARILDVLEVERAA